LKGLRVCVDSFKRSVKLRRGLYTILAIFLLLQVYFVRELLAAELLFAAAFAVLFLLGGVVYLTGLVAERGLDVTEAGVRMIAESTRSGFEGLEEVSRKPFRRPRSESAQ
jgi:hypothetical protein